MEIWVYRPSYGGLERVVISTNSMTEEEFAAEWCDYFPEDIYFFAELVSL
jgi:hypothetical protein